MSYKFSPEDAEDLFSKTKEINSNITKANEPFYHNIIYKPQQSIYLIIIVIIVAIEFILFFFQLVSVPCGTFPFNRCFHANSI